jgi:hypothetical protein
MRVRFHHQVSASATEIEGHFCTFNFLPDEKCKDAIQRAIDEQFERLKKGTNDSPAI